MRYLTQAVIGMDQAARMGLHDLYDWHQLSWRAFPGKDGARRDFLTRLDRRERDHAFRLLILSPGPPTRPQAWPDEEGAWQVREINKAFFGHDRYRFQLRANPTRRDNATRKRIPLKTDEELAGWLRRKAEAGGFLVADETLRMIRLGREWFRIDGRSREGIHHAVEYDGVLGVTDRAKFAEAFAKGIGSAKAFGFGLLALVPLRGETR